MNFFIKINILKLGHYKHMLIYFFKDNEVLYLIFQIYSFNYIIIYHNHQSRQGLLTLKSIARNYFSFKIPSSYKFFTKPFIITEKRYVNYRNP